MSREPGGTPAAGCCRAGTKQCRVSDADSRPGECRLGLLQTHSPTLKSRVFLSFAPGLYSWLRSSASRTTSVRRDQDPQRSCYTKC